jgi:hypothetical protein
MRAYHGTISRSPEFSVDRVSSAIVCGLNWVGLTIADERSEDVFPDRSSSPAGDNLPDESTTYVRSPDLPCLQCRYWACGLQIAGPEVSGNPHAADAARRSDQISRPILSAWGKCNETLAITRRQCDSYSHGDILLLVAAPACGNG